MTQGIVMRPAQKQQLGEWQINRRSEEVAGKAVLYGGLGDGGTPAIYVLTWFPAELVFPQTWASF